MCHALSVGQNVKISGFGTFILRDKGQRVGRNPEDRHRGADRSAARDDLPRQPDHARPDRQGLIWQWRPADKGPGALKDDRGIVAGAGRRPAHPALLGNAISAAAADAARRQPPLLSAGGCRAARRIHRLLNQEGYTVRGVQKVLRDKEAQPVEVAHAVQEVASPSPMMGEMPEPQQPTVDVFRLISLRNRLAAAIDL